MRGFRIELGEIEAALLGVEGVREAVVVVREDAPGSAGPRLVAYVAPAAGAEVTAAELRARLHERLPEYMVPAAFVVLESIPLTANGKVDRRALPAPERSGGGREGGAPLTAAERAVAAIWEEVLGVPHIGVGDNFFDLGGHSLLLVQVHSRLQERFPDRVALVDLFAHRTLGALAAQLGSRRRPGRRSRPGWAGRRTPRRCMRRKGRRRRRRGPRKLRKRRERKCRSRGKRRPGGATSAPKSAAPAPGSTGPPGPGAKPEPTRSSQE